MHGATIKIPCKIFAIIIHEQVSHHLKSKFNPRQTPSTSSKKMKGTVSDLLTGIERSPNLILDVEGAT
jgi:hypothetical protein